MPTWLRIRMLRASAIALGTVVLSLQAAAQSGVGQACGGPAGPNCTVGLFCEIEKTGQCKADDPTGTCVVRTEACPKIYKPVCGCDGETYANDCLRVAAAARKDHDGECKPSQ